MEGSCCFSFCSGFFNSLLRHKERGLCFTEERSRDFFLCKDRPWIRVTFTSESTSNTVLNLKKLLKWRPEKRVLAQLLSRCRQ